MILKEPASLLRVVRMLRGSDAYRNNDSGYPLVGGFMYVDGDITGGFAPHAGLSEIAENRPGLAETLTGGDAGIYEIRLNGDVPLRELGQLRPLIESRTVIDLSALRKKARREQQDEQG